MKKSKIAALIGSILFTFIALGTITILIVGWMLAKAGQLDIGNITTNELLIAMLIAGALFILLLTLNWIGFAKLKQSKKWSKYFLGIGVFYLLASMFNGIGLIVTLPVSICFILAYVFRRQESKDEEINDGN